MKTKQKPNPRTGQKSFGLTAEETAKALAETQTVILAEFQELLVAVRGGGDLKAAMKRAQDFIDDCNAPAVEDKTPNFASDEAAELAFSLNETGTLSSAAVAQIEGTGKDGAITVEDLKKAAGPEPDPAPAKEDEKAAE